MSFDNDDIRNFKRNVPFKLIDNDGKPIIEVTHNGIVSKPLKSIPMLNKKLLIDLSLKKFDTPGLETFSRNLVR